MKRWSNLFTRSVFFLFVVVGLGFVPRVQAQNDAFDGIVTVLEDHYKGHSRARSKRIKNFKNNIIDIIEEQADSASADDCKTLKSKLEDIKACYIKSNMRNKKNAYVVKALRTLEEKMRQRGFIEEINSDQESYVTDDTNNGNSLNIQEQEGLEQEEFDEQGGIELEPEVPVQEGQYEQKRISLVKKFIACIAIASLTALSFKFLNKSFFYKHVKLKKVNKKINLREILKRLKKCAGNKYENLVSRIKASRVENIGKFFRRHKSY